MLVEQLNTLLTIEDKDSNEYQISQYILKNMHLFTQMKMNELIKDMGVSKSTLARFCKMLGYRNYTDVQYQIYKELSTISTYHNQIEMTEGIHRNIDLIKNKKRIIILGEATSISPLLVYKQLFSNLGIEFILKIKVTRAVDLLEEYHINDKDLIIYVSLYQTNLQILADIFVPYLEFAHYLEAKKIPFIYLGQIASKNEIEDNYIEIKKTNNISDSIYQMCNVFENIYSLLDN